MRPSPHWGQRPRKPRFIACHSGLSDGLVAAAPPNFRAFI
jgi:hypothetical protein